MGCKLVTIIPPRPIHSSLPRLHWVPVSRSDSLSLTRSLSQSIPNIEEALLEIWFGHRLVAYIEIFLSINTNTFDENKLENLSLISGLPNLEMVKLQFRSMHSWSILSHSNLFVKP